MKRKLRIASIFLLGTEQNLISQDEQEQETKTDEILEKLKIDLTMKSLVRKEEDLNKVDTDKTEALVIFPCCPYRFTPLIHLIESGVPTVINGTGRAFSGAVDTYAYLADYPNVELAFSDEEVKAKLNAIEAARWVKNARIVVFGLERIESEYPAWFKNPIGLGKLNTIFVGKQRVLEAYKKADSAEAKRLAKWWISECILKEPSFEDVVLSARVYLALKIVIEQADADGAYMPWCGQFTKDFGTKPCFAIAKIADEGIPIGCWKGDNLLPMLILHATSHKPVFVCELHGPLHENNTLELRHCFSPTKLSEGKPILRQWRSMLHTVTAYCQLPKGEVTLVNSGIGDKILITTAEVQDCKDLEGDNCRITIFAQLPNEQTVSKLQAKEFALVYGDHTRDTQLAAKKLGLKIL
ncbi:MAG: hypothetical protein ACLFU9_04270 [Candidatus Bathyarchaeia archaeon]